MSSSSPNVRHRGPGKKGRSTTPAPEESSGTQELAQKVQKEVKTAVKSDWEYKLAFGIITAIAFATRFYAINFPDQVVFDEVHFGKVCTTQGEGLNALLTAGIVCIALPTKDLLLRCTSSIWQAPLRFGRLVRWLQWGVPLR